MIKTKSLIHLKSNNPSKRISGQFVLFWWFLSLSLPALFLSFGSVKMQDNMIVYISLWLFIVFGFFVFIRRWLFSAILGRPFDILEIPVYLGLTSIFLIQVFGLVPYFDRKYLRLLPSVSYLPLGLLLTGIGLFSMLFGYALVSKSYRPDSTRPSHTFYDTPSLSLTFFAYIGLLILRLVLISFGIGEMMVTTTVRLGGDWNQWFIYLIELHWFLIALVTLQVAAGRWPRRFLVFVLLIEGALAITSGWSSLLPKIAVLVFGCLIYARQKLPWRPLISAGIVLVSVTIFSIPVARDLRGARMSTGQVTLTDIKESIESTWGVGVGNGLNLFLGLLIQRQTVTAQTPSILLNLIPSTIPYLPWQDMAVAPITFIPRVIWPSKPVYSNLGSWLTVQVFGGREEDGSSAVTLAGNAYIYGGWLVAIIGMFMIGVLAALIYRWLAIPGLLNGQVGLLAVYAAVVIVNFHLGEGDFVSLWQGLVQRILVFIIMARVLCSKTAMNFFHKVEV
jgi:hypothetical protein